MGPIDCAHRRFIGPRECHPLARENPHSHRSAERGAEWRTCPTELLTGHGRKYKFFEGTDPAASLKSSACQAIRTTKPAFY